MQLFQILPEFPLRGALPHLLSEHSEVTSISRKTRVKIRHTSPGDSKSHFRNATSIFPAAHWPHVPLLFLHVCAKGLAATTCPLSALASPFSERLRCAAPAQVRSPGRPHSKLGCTSISDGSPHRLIAAPARPAASALPSSRCPLTSAVLLRHQHGQLRHGQQQQQQHPQSALPHLAAAQQNNATPLRPPATRAHTDRPSLPVRPSACSELPPPHWPPAGRQPPAATSSGRGRDPSGDGGGRGFVAPGRNTDARDWRELQGAEAREGRRGEECGVSLWGRAACCVRGEACGVSPASGEKGGGAAGCSDGRSEQFWSYLTVIFSWSELLILEQAGRLFGMRQL